MNKDIIYREDAIKAVEDVSENYTKEGDREWHPHIDFITQALVQVSSVPLLDIVRCKECKNKDPYCDYCHKLEMNIKADDYCSYGEREGE